MLEDLQSSVSADLPPLVQSVNHLQPLKLPPQFTVNASGVRLAVTGGQDTFVLRASRLRLRQWLSTKVPITYGKQLINVEEADDAVTAYFQDGTTATGDILVGADGINSRGT